MSAQQLRLGVIGCGQVFERFHLPALREVPAWQLRAVCDPDQQRRGWAVDVNPGAAAFRSAEQMLTQVELDAVLIATPPEQHAELAARAVEGGLHALIEKPGGRGVNDAGQIAGAAARSDRVVWVAFNRRFNPNYMAIRKLLAANPPPSVADLEFELSFSVVEWNSISAYLGDDERGGDVARDLTSHQLDLLGWMFNSPVTAVRCHAWHRSQPGEEILKYAVCFSDGTTVECVAEHGEQYRESLSGSIGGVHTRLYPTGLLRSKLSSFRSLQRWANLRYWLDRKLIRIGALNDPLRLSYRNQLEAFAARIMGDQSAVEGTSAESALITQRAMDLLTACGRTDDKWQALEPIATEGAGRMSAHLGPNSIGRKD